MVEPVTTVGLGAIIAYLSKDGIEKLLGPTAEYLGQGIRDLAQKRIEAIGRILKVANSKISNSTSDDVAVPPKLLRHIINEGSFADSEVEIAYLGGILSSSRSPNSRDNRSIRFAKILDGMSNYQILAHYLIYRTLHNVYPNAKEIGKLEVRTKLGLFVDFRSFIDSMNMNEAESEGLESLVPHIFFGLHGDGLIDSPFSYGDKKKMGSYSPENQNGGLYCVPSIIGIELFLWAFGEGAAPPERLFESDFDPMVEGVDVGFAHAHSVQH